MKTTSSTPKFPVFSSVIFTVILSLLSFSLQAQKLIWNDTLDKKIDSAVASIMEKDQFPGVAVAIVQNGKVLKESYYGLASIEYQVPVSDSTVFWIASISKHFDCAGILRLQQEGKLNVKDRIDNYLDSLPETWKNITIEQLMTHTSGLPEDSKEALWDSKEVTYGKTISSETIYEILKKDSLQFAPGTNFLYSGSGYSLLALIMEKVSGLGYDDFMEKYVFTPAGLKGAYTKKVLEIHPNQVTGYQVVDGRLFRDNNRFPITDLQLGGGGAVYSTLKDMIRWNAALNANDFLSKESKQAMWTSYEFDDKIPPLYGYGFMVIDTEDLNYAYHSGTAGTQYFKYLSKGIDIIVLSNLGNHPNLPFVSELLKVLGIFPEIDAEKFAGIFDLELDKEGYTKVEKYAGDYEFEFNDQKFHPIIKSSEQGLDFYWEEKFDPIPLIPLKRGWLMLFDAIEFFPVPSNMLLKPMQKENTDEGTIQLQMDQGSWPRVILTKVN